MKKNILIGLSVLAIVFLAFYSKIKATEAEQNAILAQEMSKMTVEIESSLNEKIKDLELKLGDAQTQLANCSSTD